MRLTSFRVTMYQSILDSGPVDVDDVTCLVGKNEAGKTALLKALYKLNPIRSEDAAFSVTDDYPRAEVGDYQDDVESGRRQHAPVIEATFVIDKDLLSAITELFGPKFLKNNTVSVTKYYNNKRLYNLSCDEQAASIHLKKNLPKDIKEKCNSASTPKELLATLQSDKENPAVAPLIPILTESGEAFSSYVSNKILKPKEPRYLYFDEYYQMHGCENIDALQQRLQSNQLTPSDQPLLGLIDLARLNLDQMLNPDRTQELKNKLEAAGNRLTQRILKFWSQNKHLQMRFDVRPARPGDPEGMKQGTNIWGEVYDTKHLVSTSLGSRSRGFVWFFSFVSWYSQIRKNEDNVILLLDEPGLTLHGKAQGDLLRYFETELKPAHQLLYSTHSPFMVDANHFERVRIVQDLSNERDDLPRDKEGTRVIKEIFDATDDSIFPLQGALGYEIYQSLFIGPNSLLVEGPSDMLYLRAISTVLAREGRVELSDDWTLTPVGGASKISTFVRLLIDQKGMKIATLIDIQNNEKKIVEDLYKTKLLKKTHVRTFSEYTSQEEADIEDMFDEKFYIDLVNLEYKKELQAHIKSEDIKDKNPRILKRLESVFDKAPLKSGRFSHYRPARYLHENLEQLASKVSDETKDRFEKAFEDLNNLL